jgi:hypothetical protein
MSTAGMAGSWWWATMDACFLSSSQWPWSGWLPA